MNTLNFGPVALVSANISWDIFVAKYSPSGEHLWSKNYGSPTITGFETDSGTGIVYSTSDNSIIVAGVYDTNVDFGGELLGRVSGVNSFVVKLNADGSRIWSRRLGGNNGTVARSVAIDKSGNILLTG